jgi:hypothetical protein
MSMDLNSGGNHSGGRLQVEQHLVIACKDCWLQVALVIPACSSCHTPCILTINIIVVDTHIC